MVLCNKSKTEKLIVVNCNCGCNEEIHIHKYLDIPEEYYLIIMKSKFDSLQDTAWGKIKFRLKRIWHAICGKEYRLCEINLTKDDILDLIDSLEKIIK